MNIYDPQRAKYRQKIKRIKRCEFCNGKNIKDQECKNLSNKNWLVLVNKYPYMDGNVMLIPRRHIKDPSEFNEAEKKDFFTILEKTKNKLGKIFKTKDFNVGLNIGKRAGSSIEHLHWQVIPRHDKILNSANIFGNLYVITMSPKELKKMIEKS